MRALTIPIVLAFALPILAQEEDPFTATIYVVRYALDVRVTTLDGQAIEDIKPEEFTVKIGGRVAHVESATWVPLGSRARIPQSRVVDLMYGDEEEAENLEDFAISAEESPRSIVLLILTDIARQNDRVLGQVKFHYIADDILKHLAPADRVAVLSHDSHLKFRLDFTNDHAKIRKAIRDSLFTDIPPPPAPATDGPTLTGLLDKKQMKRAAHGEAAMLVVANALQAIEGEKVLMIAGYGLGEVQGRAGLQLKSEWNDAVAQLREQHVQVISLHTGFGAQLAGGLAATATATGGMYEDARGLEDLVVKRVAGALSGYYALSLRIDELLEPGKYPLSVRVARKKAVVEAPPFVLHGQ